MRASSILVSAVGMGLLVGCNGSDDPACATYDEVFVWVDEDGDGFGSEEPIGYVCTPAVNQAENKVDCDDTNPEVFPGREEICDLVDNDCNGLVDEANPKVPWYPDADGDGYGDDALVESNCIAPGPDWTETPGDCDDANPAVNSGANEICNDGIDDDCDGLADDSDPGVDPTTLQAWHPDADGDGYGDTFTVFERCDPPGLGVLDGQDCNDSEPGVNPDGLEVCDDFDNDCDGLYNDYDPDLDTSTQSLFQADADGDGYGDPVAMAPACFSTPGFGVDNGLDCDDTDPWANVTQGWFGDEDGDGSGVVPLLLTQCLNPGPGYAPQQNGQDCDDLDPTRAPHLDDICGDGIDQDCSELDLFCDSTCKMLQDGAPALPTGIHDIYPTGVAQQVYCDMGTDGGGWTLVASSIATFNDAAIGYHTDLTTLVPLADNNGVWQGLRPAIQQKSDIRFACKANPAAPNFVVDLSFYDTVWYKEISGGGDGTSCFNEGNGTGADPPPMRRNNLTGATLPAGDPWNAGYLEGEDTCGDSGDFTVDFDDRGKDGNQSDGTDWGEDDSTMKCGVSGVGSGAWFIFVREN